MRVIKNKSSPLFFILFLFCMALLVSGCFSDKTSRENPSAAGTFDQLLPNIHQNGTFVFEGLPWLISGQEVMNRQQLVHAPSEQADVLIVEGNSPTEGPVKQITVYKFEDDRLVSGEYGFLTSDQDRFVELVEELQGLLSESLGTPFANDLSVLDPTGDFARQAKHVAWQGTDRSQLRVNVSTTEQQEYFLHMQIASPLPERQGLQ
ncbi:hypothetical protein ACFQWB_00185 [Paenibacillus thermoaerophilus]|uniref:Lipoprotein n=1 Tax=Paenibacillus thermoaerophilus TaxID=1215385 RepID=A0ABW2UWR4_9BACL|nr:hypothetical protein [Paenibacillus thermoaerophilus]TMV15888.1 hypothetical protein FE781_09875 [Paenibacillus thermoaerophilus]